MLTRSGIDENVKAATVQKIDYARVFAETEVPFLHIEIDVGG